MFKVIVLALAVLAAVTHASDVIEASESNFDELTGEGFSLVKFYAPWCGHCKNLAPHWEEAATQLKGHAKLIKVDATVESTLAAKFEIQGYPTIKVFQDGVASDYEGGRTANDLVSFVKRRLSPIVELIRTKEQLESLKGPDVVVLLYTNDEDGESLKEFTQVATQMRDIHRFGAIVKAALFDGHKEGDLVMQKPFESEPVTLSLAERTGENAVVVEEWIRKEAFPLVNEIGPENYRNYIERGIPIAWLFVEDSTSSELPRQLVLSSAQAHKGKLSFVYLSGSRYRQLLARYGFKGESFPLFVIESASHFWSFPEDKAVTEEAIQTFCDEFVAGTLSRTILSEAIPEQATEKGLTTIVGHTVEELVLSSSKDVLIEFYAPWCGHCKKLAPIYEEVAEKLEAIDTILVAKMDATANEVPDEFQVAGFPTIYFKPAGKQAILFEGERTADGFLDFIQKHATHPVQPTQSSEDGKQEL